MVNIEDVSVMQGLKRRMNYLTERQGVLAQNVANADTPGYKPKDLKPVDFRGEVERASLKLQPAATQPGHMKGTGKGQRFDVKDVADDTFETTPSGNGVILEEEMLKMNKTATDYQSTTMLYRKLTNLMRMAVDGNSN